MQTKSFTKQQFLDLLQQKAASLGRTPTAHDTGKKHGIPSYKTYTEYFGSWNKALILAGLIPNNESFSKEEIIKRIQEWYEKNKRVPKMHELRSLGLPARTTMQRHFGSYSKALLIAGLPIVRVGQGCRANLGKNFEPHVLKLDFTMHHDTYQKLLIAAEEELRTLNNQALFIIRDYFRKN